MVRRVVCVKFECSVIRNDRAAGLIILIYYCLRSIASVINHYMIGCIPCQTHTISMIFINVYVRLTYLLYDKIDWLHR